MTTQTQTVTLAPSDSWATVSDLLDCPAGVYASFTFFYVLRRNGVQQTGEFNINDTGADVQAEHEWTIVPNDGDPQIEFEVTHNLGKRVFWYKTTGGDAVTRFTFQIAFRFG